MHTGIYKIVNTTTGRLYVGSGVDVRDRMRRHRRALRKGDHDNQSFQNAWNKYGEEAFSFEVLLYCARKNLILYEQRAIDVFNAADKEFGYNICSRAYSKLGVPCSERSKQVTRERMTGHPPPEANRRITAARNKTLKQRLAVSAALKGRVIKPEWIAKANLKRTGRPLTEAQRKSLEPYWQSRRGVKRPDLSAKLLGHPCSPETRAKMSASRKQWWERKLQPLSAAASIPAARRTRRAIPPSGPLKENTHAPGTDHTQH